MKATYNPETDVMYVQFETTPQTSFVPDHNSDFTIEYDSDQHLAGVRINMARYQKSKLLELLEMLDDPEQEFDSINIRNHLFWAFTRKKETRTEG